LVLATTHISHCRFAQARSNKIEFSMNGNLVVPRIGLLRLAVHRNWR
jgi:hypothetical protein